MNAVILNASFMLDHKKEAEFLSFIEKETEHINKNNGEGPTPSAPRISRMLDANGQDYSDADAQTVAVQWEFPSLSEARVWREREFGAVSEKFSELFGPECMVFTSVFEVLYP